MNNRCFLPALVLLDEYFTPSHAFVLLAGGTCTWGNASASKCHSPLLLHQLLLSNTQPCICIFILLPYCLLLSPLFLLNVLFCARETGSLCLYTVACISVLSSSSAHCVVCFCSISRPCQDLPPLTISPLQPCFGKQCVRSNVDWWQIHHVPHGLDNVQQSDNQSLLKLHIWTEPWICRVITHQDCRALFVQVWFATVAMNVNTRAIINKVIFE